MIEIGRICVKLAGRDAGRECAIVDILDDKYVLIDGNVRRRKCNIFHLEPTEKKIDIEKNASHEDVAKEFSKLSLPVWETKKKEAKERPTVTRSKDAVVEDEKIRKTKKKNQKKDGIDARIISVTKKDEGKKKKEIGKKKEASDGVKKE